MHLYSHICCVLCYRFLEIGGNLPKVTTIWPASENSTHCSESPGGGGWGVLTGRVITGLVNRAD
jgi:hypothetical protein